MGSLHNVCRLEQNSIIGWDDDQRCIRGFSPDVDFFLLQKSLRAS